MTASTAVITVLHTAEVVQVPHELRLSLESQILIVPMSTLTHFCGVCYENHYKAVQWSHLACNILTEVSPQCEHRTHPKAPSCALCVPTIVAVPTPSHGSAIAASPNIPAVLPSQLPRRAGWYAKTKLYHILC
jgi:hypothetical protein